VTCGAQPIDVFLLQEENEMRRVIFLKRQVQVRAENTSPLALWLPHLCFLLLIGSCLTTVFEVTFGFVQRAFEEAKRADRQAKMKQVLQHV
jgi:hypothetical protein